MKYRIRHGQGDTCYRKKLDSIVRNAEAGGSIVECNAYEGKYWVNNWEPIGIALDGRFYDSVKFVHAFDLSKVWGNMNRPKFGFANILKEGEIEFDYKFTGLTNLLSTPLKVHAIRFGERFNPTMDGGKYHYVVTDYGRELGNIVRVVFRKES